MNYAKSCGFATAKALGDVNAAAKKHTVPEALRSERPIGQLAHVLSASLCAPDV
jgi:hypothetical protein